MKKILISVSALFLFLFVLTAFFLLSKKGLQFSVQLVSSATDDRISIEKSTGRLIGPLKLEGIRFHSPQTNVFIKKLALEWRPMGLLQNRLHIPELLVEGVEVTMAERSLDAPAAINGTGPVVNNGTGSLTLSKLHVPLPENDVKDEIELADTQITFRLHDQILTAALSSSSVDGSTIDLGVAVDQFGDLSLPMVELPLEGNVRVDIANVGFLKQLSGDMLVPSGQLSADFIIGGTIQRPLFDGGGALEGGEIVIPDLGLLLSNIALGVEGDKNGFSIDLLANSGDGKVTGTGSVFLEGLGWR